MNIQIYPIPDNWEECQTHEATHVWVSTANSLLPTSLNLDHDLTIRIADRRVSGKQKHMTNGAVYG